MRTTPTIHPAHHVWRPGLRPATRKTGMGLTLASAVAVLGFVLALVILWGQP